MYVDKEKRKTEKYKAVIHRPWRRNKHVVSGQWQKVRDNKHHCASPISSLWLHHICWHPTDCPILDSREGAGHVAPGERALQNNMAKGMGIGKGEELGLNDISTAPLADFPQNSPSV